MRVRVKFTKFSEARLINAQDKVLEGYGTRFRFTTLDLRRLHMFFSPTRVPKGLTRREITMVLLLCDLRNMQKCQAEDETLPKELRPDGRMTRKGFQAGIRKFLREATQC